MIVDLRKQQRREETPPASSICFKWRVSAVSSSFGSATGINVNTQIQHGSTDPPHLLHVLHRRVSVAAASPCGVQAALPCTVKLYSSRWCKQHSFSQAINDQPSRTFTTGDTRGRPTKSCRTTLKSWPQACSLLYPLENITRFFQYKQVQDQIVLKSHQQPIVTAIHLSLPSLCTVFD